MCVCVCASTCGHACLTIRFTHFAQLASSDFFLRKLDIALNGKHRKWLGDCLRPVSECGGLSCCCYIHAMQLFSGFGEACF